MKNVLIIGGGFAGAYCAKKLERDFEVTLIDTKDYFEFTPSVLRTIVEPEHLSKIQVLHTTYLHRSSILQGEVTSVTPADVNIGKQTFPYDYLIIASGSTYNSPIKERDLVIASRADELREYAQRLEKAASVLIIGGGLVGVELAAEIIVRYPQKKITVVHANNELIERNPSRARAYARQFLERRGVTLLFGERVLGKKKKRYVTNKKRELSADLAFLCTGIKPNYEFLKKNFSASLTSNHAVKVTPTLQVEGRQNIFAAGDISSIPEEKTAQNAEKQAEMVVRNIYHCEKKEILEEYRSEPRIMVISLGKWDGMLVYKNFVLTGLIPGLLKQGIEWKTMQRYRK